MRNVFNQYKLEENRLTHALITSLEQSAPLLKAFTALAGHPIPKGAQITIRGQFRPGAPENVSEQDAERLSLPDAWLDDGRQHWALVVESKVESPIDLNQLRRHRQAAERFGAAQVVLISIEKPSPTVGSEFRCLRWTQIYECAVALKKTDWWAKSMAEYMEIAERRLLSEGKQLKGTLTTFTGIPFRTEPYSYPEAKRLLGLLMDVLRSDPLMANLGADLLSEGRSAITGRDAHDVWDMFPFAGNDPHFTDAPHLTVGIRHNEGIAQLTIPHQVKQRLRRPTIGLSFEEFREVIAEFTRRVEPLMIKDPGCRPFVEVVQRHWTARRGLAISDALLVFDPRTIEGAKPVDKQPQWVRAAFDVMTAKRSNLQIAFGVRFPYVRSDYVAKSSYPECVAQAFAATSHIVDRWRVALQAYPQ